LHRDLLRPDNVPGHPHGQDNHARNLQKSAQLEEHDDLAQRVLEL
jgi:hypothetical protein